MRQMLSEVTELEFQEEANAMDGWSLFYMSDSNLLSFQIPTMKASCKWTNQ